MISSDLIWMAEAQRDRIHEIASRRLSERCGRTGKRYYVSFVLKAQELTEVFFDVLCKFETD
jgi:hypothetical protein